MENKKLEFEPALEQPLDQWIDDCLKPILQTIGEINNLLESELKAIE